MLTIEPEALTSAGIRLFSSPASGSAPTCQPPAADPVSASVAAVFNAHSAMVEGLLSHAAAVREVGGVSVTGTGQLLAAADEANAAAITSSTPPAGDLAPPAVSVPPAPVMPVVPALVAPAPLPGEQIASLVHSGPGPGSLRSAAAQFRSQAQQVHALADTVRGQAAAIDQGWVDGQQTAGRNVAEHADWLNTVGTHLSTLGNAADESAGHAESLIQQTPRPEVFTDLRGRLRQAIANFNASRGLNPAPVTALMGELSAKQGQAIEAHQGYYAAAVSTTGGVAPAPASAPSITRAGEHKLEPDPGSVRHKESDKPGGDGHGDKSGGIDPADDPGTGLVDPASTAGVPVGQPAPPPIPAAASGMEGIATQIAGALVGAGTSSLGQAAGGLHSLAAAPMSALSALGGGMPQMPQMPQMPDGGGAPDPDLGSGGSPDFGPGSTTPAGGGGAASGASPVSAPAVGGVVSSASPAAGLTGPGFTPAGAGSGAGMGGGMPMMPPFFGGGRPDSERGKGGKNKRVVLRQIPNTQAVLGAVEWPRRRRTSKEQENVSEEE